MIARDAVETLIKDDLTDMYISVGLPLTLDDAATIKATVDILRALSAENERLREKVEGLQKLGPVISHHLNIIEEETKTHVAMNGVARNNIRYSASRIRAALTDTASE